MKRFLLFLFCLASLQSVKAQVILNEFSAANASTIQDNFNEYEDWIELHNPGASPLNITGYHLSDDATQPMKWQIPNGVTIPAGGHQLFFASGRNITTGPEYHTSFKVVQSTQNEELVLADPSGVILDSITIRPHQGNHSIGKAPNGGAVWAIYSTPTPGAANGATSFAAYAPLPQFSIAPGFYAAAQNLVLSAPAGYTVRYTTDGSEPSAASTAYSAPIAINQTTLVRARCYPTAANVLPGFIESNTYFINVSHTVPVVSLGSINYSNLFASNMWEINSSLEYYVNQNLVAESYGTVDPHGNDSWAYAQKGVDFVVRDYFGYDDQIDYQIFPTKPRAKFQRIMFKAGASDNYPFTPAPGGGCHLRDHFIQGLSREAGIDCDSRTGITVVLYINGDYWGVYEVREKVNDPDFTKFYWNQDEEDLDFLSYWGGLTVRYGSAADWQNLYAFIMGNNMTDPAIYAQVAQRLDLSSVIDYMIINTYSVNSDWINWNSMWWRGFGTPQVPWRYTLWDMDNTFNLGQNYSGWPTTNYTADPCDLDQQFQNAGANMGHVDIFGKLYQNPDFKSAFINRWAELMNTKLNCGFAIPYLDSIVNVLTPEMPQQFARWGGNNADWQGNLTYLRNQITGRCSVITQGIIDCYQVTGPYELKFTVDPPLSGNIMFNQQIIPTYPDSGLYFGNVSASLQALPAPNYQFWYWEVFNHSLTPDTVSLITSFMIDTVDSIVAHFREIITHDILYAVQPSGAGQLLINGVGYPSYPQTITYQDSAWINLEAISATGFDFDHYESNNHVLTPSMLDSLVQFRALDDDTIVAVFKPEYQPTLTVLIEPEGMGLVEVNGIEPTQFPYTKQVPAGTQIPVEAVDLERTEHAFHYWEWKHQGVVPDSASREGSILLLVDDTLIAHFKPIEKIIPVVFVPSSFTPNNDGINDALRIFHSPNIQGGHMTIYDRWGTKIKVLSTLEDSWDATYQGAAVDQGVYPYVLNYTNDKGHELVSYGQITILR